MASSLDVWDRQNKCRLQAKNVARMSSHKHQIALFNPSIEDHCEICILFCWNVCHYLWKMPAYNFLGRRYSRVVEHILLVPPQPSLSSFVPSYIIWPNVCLLPNWHPEQAQHGNVVGMMRVAHGLPLWSWILAGVVSLSGVQIEHIMRHYNLSS